MTRASEMAAFARQNCPKLAAIAESIRTDDRKTAVIIHRENGLRTLMRLLSVAGVSVAAMRPTTGVTGAALQAVRRENRERLEAFNDRTRNVRGETVRVLVLPAEQFSEGVSMRNVRRLVLADLSPRLEPPRWAIVKQRVGRALRMCSHTELPEGDRTLTVQLFVAVHVQPRSSDERGCRHAAGSSADHRRREVGAAAARHGGRGARHGVSAGAQHRRRPLPRRRGAAEDLGIDRHRAEQRHDLSAHVEEKNKEKSHQPWMQKLTDQRSISP